MKIFKKLLVPLIIMFVLIIIVAVYFIIQANKNDNTEVNAEAVVSMSLYDVKSINVYSSETGNDIGFSATIDDSGMQIWSLIGSENDSSIEVDQNKVSSYVQLLTNFTAQALVAEDSTDLAQYGLNPAQYTITITDISGNVTKVLMGNKLASGSYAYFMVEGSNKVYTVASIKYTYCGYTTIDLVSSQILDLQYNLIDTIEFTRTTDNISLTARCIPNSDGDGAQYKFIEPFITDSSSVFSDFVDNIITLKIARFIELTPEEVQLYRLDNPAYTIEFTMLSGEKVTVQFSDIVENEMYYGCSSTTDQYFVVSNQQVNGFESPIMTLIGEWICYNAASDLSQITCSYDDQNWTLDLDVPSAMSDADASIQLDLRNAKITTPDGNRTYSAILFESVACIAIGGVDFDAEPNIDDSIMTITLRTHNYTSASYDFVPRGTDSYYVIVNGQYSCFYVYASELFGYGGANTYNYGVWPAYELLNTAIENQVGGTYDLNEFIAMVEAAS